MNTAATKSGSLPVGAVAVNALGGLFIAAGALGLFAPDVLNAVPALRDPTTAWTLLGAGIALDVGAAVVIVGHLRSRRQAPRAR